MMVGRNNENAYRGPTFPAYINTVRETFINRGSRKRKIWLTREIGLPVGESLPNVLRLEFFSRSAVLVVRLQSTDENSSLGVGEELGAVGEVLDDPKGQEPCHNRRETFQNKDPRPAGFPTDPIHFGDCGLSESQVNNDSRGDTLYVRRADHRMRLTSRSPRRKPLRGYRTLNVCTN